MSEHISYMQKVLELAQEKQGDSDVPIAAIIVKDGEIIATGSNSREAENSILGHAEINAMEAAAQKLGDWNLSGATLYVNLEPCPMCAGAILQSHISEVIFGAYDAKAGALGSRYDLRTKNLKVTGGILEAECVQLLQSFFSTLREKPYRGKSAGGL